MQKGGKQQKSSSFRRMQIFDGNMAMLNPGFCIPDGGNSRGCSWNGGLLHSHWVARVLPTKLGLSFKGSHIQLVFTWRQVHRGTVIFTPWAAFCWGAFYTRSAGMAAGRSVRWWFSELESLDGTWMPLDATGIVCVVIIGVHSIDYSIEIWYMII